MYVSGFDADCNVEKELNKLSHQFQFLLGKLHIRLPHQTPSMEMNKDSIKNTDPVKNTIASTSCNSEKPVALEFKSEQKSSSSNNNTLLLMRPAEKESFYTDTSKQSGSEGKGRHSTTKPSLQTRVMENCLGSSHESTTAYTLPDYQSTCDVSVGSSQSVAFPLCCRRCENGQTAAAFGDIQPATANGDLLIQSYLHSLENCTSPAEQVKAVLFFYWHRRFV